MSEPYAWADGLVRQLGKLANPDDPDRAALAHLRRGLCGPPDYTLSRVGWLFRTVPTETNDRVLDNAILAAGLFAWVKGVCPQNGNVNFGRAFGSGLSDDDKAQREKRFTDLLNTDVEELPYKLRQAITLIARDKIGLDWVTLIKHLIHWQDAGRWVQKDWARGFWSTPKAEEDTADEATFIQ